MSRGSCEYLSGETSDPRLSAAVWELLSSRKGFDAKADALFSLLSAEQCAPRPLLDDIVLRLERSKLAWSSVLDPLLQSLYYLGHHGLRITLRERARHTSLAERLHGEEVPLKAFYETGVCGFGEQALRCGLEFEGQAGDVARNARDSSFVVRGAARSIGERAYGCSFALSDGDGISPLAEASDFHVQRISEEKLDALRKSGFLGKNRLYLFWHECWERV